MKDRIHKKPKKTERLTIVGFSRLQICLLSILQDRKEHSIEDLSKKVYQLAGKRAPITARQAVTGMIRETDTKLTRIGARIRNGSNGMGGRGNLGVYRMTGDVNEVKQIVERMTI